MRLYRLTAFCAAVVAALALTVGGTATTLAASQHSAGVAAYALPATHETSKIVLPETSIDGPALSSIQEGQSAESVIAWAGTDALHHLNVETSTDGLHFGNKLTLRENSAYRPDVALAGVGGPVIVAWTGTDAHHSLNVLYDVYGSNPKKLTLWNENSFTAPAVLYGPSFFLAWTGTDANHSLNILPLSVTSSGLVAGQKTVLSQFSSNAGPHLARGSATVMDLLWTSRVLQPRIATSTDGVHFGQGVGLPETSAYAPDTFALGPFMGADNPVWVGWTGTDAAHHLNLESATPQLSGEKTVLGETALGGPALGYDQGNQLAWTGTDAAHHVNVAKFVAG